jgi:hypothetical protein
MRRTLYKPWDANTPFENLIKQIQDCRDIACSRQPTILQRTNLERRFTSSTKPATTMMTFVNGAKT